MFGELIAKLDQPAVAAAVLTTLDPVVMVEVKRRASAASMTVTDFVAGAVHEFIERGNDDQWFQLLTVLRKSEDPGLTAVQTILTWASTAS
jgi:hypothetical protein